MTKAMELTVTQKLRLFLARSGQAVAPWSSVEEVMDRLYRLLFERREQAGLWEDLAALLDSIQADACGVLAAPDAEILSQSRVNELVAELRRAMRASVETPAAGAMRRFSVGKSASVLACIALLAAGFSLGCSSSTSRADGGADAPTTAADAIQLTDKAPTPDTATSLAPDSAPSSTPDVAPGSTPDAAVTELDAAGDAAASPADATTDGSSDSISGDALMDLFRDGTPEDIAARLEASVADTPVDRQVDKPMALYKGVTFPTEKIV
ncbi:MAG: hypothetical protein ABSF35_03805 [Polyangia bacterium]